MNQNTSIITRHDYIHGNHADKFAIHCAYYAQFITAAHLARLKRIGYTKIRESNDPHFNDIPLTEWDRLSLPIPHDSVTRMKECGDYPTLSGAVCILKEAARQYRAMFEK